ncbi:MAG: hypothetical protein AAGK00_10775 [Pseudomonadota bacterium]
MTDDDQIHVFSTNMRLIWIFVAILAVFGIFSAVLLLLASTPSPEDVTAALIVLAVTLSTAAFLGWYGERQHGKVVSVSAQGIFDRRTMTRPIDWEEVRQLSIFEVYFKGTYITLVGLEIDDVDGVNKRELGLLGEAVKAAMGLPAVSVQVTGLRPSQEAALASIIGHAPPRLHDLGSATTIEKSD